MNDPVMENEVIRRWQEQTPIRRIAAELRISRYRVKRVIKDHQTGRTQGATHPDLPRRRSRGAAFWTSTSLSSRISLLAGPP
jgi:hypothetical protein